MAVPIYGRPELTKELGGKRFREFYYLDTELTDFCKKNGLDADGDRMELVARIADFMDGKKAGPTFVLKQTAEDEGKITDETLIENGFTYGEKHKEYYAAAIGAEFVMVDDFLVWLENNAGKTYGESVNIWYLVRDDLGLY